MINNNRNHFHMVNISDKSVSFRLAVAKGDIVIGNQAFLLLKKKKIPKGDPLTLAEIAGIQGAKKTSDIIPLCHPIMLDHIEIAFTLDESNNSISSFCFASSISKTGVEMEALTGVSSSLLSIYDLIKIVEPNLIINNIQLMIKIGGKSGYWKNKIAGEIPEWVSSKIDLILNNNNNNNNNFLKNSLVNIKSAVLVLSDRASSGIYKDTSGEYILNILNDQGSIITSYQIIEDSKSLIKNKINEIINNHKPNFIITTGGTGVGPRDVTIEAIKEISDIIIPGIGEYIRFYGSRYTNLSWISRCIGAIVRGTIIICLPGSKKAVEESMECILPIMNHLINMVNEGDIHLD